MQIDIVHVPDCPHLGAVRTRLDQALARAGVAASIREVEVDTVEDAQRTGTRGSPTILIDGRDPFAVERAEASLSCRLYRTGDGVAGAPTVAQLIGVLTP
ncbi:MAG: thioredoxin family protein [Acidimicrobiia bacterium]|nr:thioredoxin family protein [Acidimicrobiia bacterium]